MTGFVYAIQSVDGGPVKIGWSRNVEGRLAQLQSAHFSQLVVLRRFEALRQHESDIHGVLSGLRLKGEWFEDAPETWDAFRAVEAKAREAVLLERATAEFKEAFNGCVGSFTKLVARAAEDGSLPTREEVVAIFLDAADGVHRTVDHMLQTTTLDELYRIADERDRSAA